MFLYKSELFVIFFNEFLIYIDFISEFDNYKKLKFIVLCKKAKNVKVRLIYPVCFAIFLQVFYNCQLI